MPRYHQTLPQQPSSSWRTLLALSSLPTPPQNTLQVDFSRSPYHPRYLVDLRHRLSSLILLQLPTYVRESVYPGQTLSPTKLPFLVELQTYGCGYVPPAAGADPMSSEIRTTLVVAAARFITGAKLGFFVRKTKKLIETHVVFVRWYYWSTSLPLGFGRVKTTGFRLGTHPLDGGGQVRRGLAHIPTPTTTTSFLTQLRPTPHTRPTARRRRHPDRPPADNRRRYRRVIGRGCPPDDGRQLSL